MDVWATAFSAWSPVLIGAVAITLLAGLRFVRAYLRAKRRQYPPTTRPPES